MENLILTTKNIGLINKQIQDGIKKYDNLISKYINNKAFVDKFSVKKQAFIKYQQEKLDTVTNSKYKPYNQTFSYNMSKWFYGVGKEFMRISWINKRSVIYTFFVVVIMVVVLALIFFGIDYLLIHFNNLPVNSGGGSDTPTT